jgi:hypothetical protein
MRSTSLLLAMLCALPCQAQRRQLKIFVVEDLNSEIKLADITLELDRSCPGATATADQSTADYSLRVARHADSPHSELALALAKPYIYILYSSRGDVLATKPVRSIGKAIGEVCKIIGAAPPKKKK